MTWDYPEEGAPLYRTTVSSGETVEIWPGDPEQKIQDARADARHVYLAGDFDLLRVPLQGGPAERLVGNGPKVGPEPRLLGGAILVTDEHVYFGATELKVDKKPGYDTATFGVYQLSKADASTVKPVLEGLPIRIAAHDENVFADLVMPPALGEPDTYGSIVRAALDGGPVEHIADTALRSWGAGALEYRSAGLAASDCYVYFILRCEDEPTYRLVALPYGARTSAP